MGIDALSRIQRVKMHKRSFMKQKNGAVWSETSEQIENWDLEVQLKNIPVEYQ